MQLAEFIYNYSKEEKNCYNGHCQLQISHMPIDVAIELLKDLQRLDEHDNSYTIELWSDGAFTVYCKDYWDVGVRTDWQRDKMIFSVGG